MAVEQHLPGNLSGPACRALMRHQQAGAVLRPCAVQFVLPDIAGRFVQFVDDDGDELF